jgi:hypothetical protein
MSGEPDIDDVYGAIGEMVVHFQLAENTYRQIGWFILDPERKQWPPMGLRRISNSRLIDTVTDMFVRLTNNHAFPNGEEKRNEAIQLRERFHSFRRYRNRLLHSHYFEIKAGHKTVAVMRSNDDIGVDPETGELLFDEEEVSAEVIRAAVSLYAADTFKLHFFRQQLLHWYPFTNYANNA